MESIKLEIRHIDVYLPKKIQKEPDYTFSPMITSSDRDQPKMGSIGLQSRVCGRIS